MTLVLKMAVLTVDCECNVKILMTLERILGETILFVM